ncbi:hypothetical protein FSF00_02705 [Listeria monocytogenes]|nr:hypothetical protein [Listeria monocytogenes]ECL1958782.1 hypothetical protein [Listeria monocytogenes]ECL1973142.1 hypothetical protein [Listeria monocytogenes]TYU45637.1 hypothetical protein FZW78_02320 [Listeria monocytogenes]
MHRFVLWWAMIFSTTKRVIQGMYLHCLFTKKDLTFPRVWFLIKWTNKIFYGTKAYCLLSKEALSWKRKFLYSKLLFLFLKN